MKPAPFEYLSPKTMQAALDLLAIHGDDARILAGGQSLVPLLNFRMARFQYLVDINGIAELAYIRLDNGTLRIGALTRYRTIETSALVAQAAPLLAEATQYVAHLPIRTRGTIGGSLAHADPAGEYAAIMLALDGNIVLKNRNDTRTLQVDDFIQGMFTTTLNPDEMIVEILIPQARNNQVFGFEEFARRPGDLAVMGVALRLDFDGDSVEDVRIVALGSSNGACRIGAAETEIKGHPLSTSVIDRACRAAAEIDAHTDIHATAELRRHLCGALLKRVLAKALAEQPKAGA
jgi:carbon-monoxide dehydrogenase medium subunit